MAAENEKSSEPVQLSEDDVVFLVSILRDPSRPQPLTTQHLIDALRDRTGR